MKSDIINSKEGFNKKFLYLAVPLALQQSINIILNFIDNIMVGKIGVAAIAAVGFSNEIYFVYLLFFIGAGGGFTIFISRYYGNKDFVTVRKIFGLQVVFFMFLSIILTILVCFFSTEIIKIFSKDSEVIERGGEYLGIISLSYVFNAVSMAIATSLVAITQNKQALYITIIVTIVNTVLNYLLIYGNFGFPKLETQGAAISTLIARIIESIMFVYVIWFGKSIFKAKLYEYWGLSKRITKAIFKISVPVFFNELTWSIGTVILVIAYSKLGTNAAASVAIGDVVINIGVIIFIAVSDVASSVISQNIGAQRYDFVRWIAKRIIVLSIILGILTSIVGLLIIEPVIYIYSLSEEVAHDTRLVLVVLAIFASFKLFNWVMLVGVLRAGGDFVFALKTDVILLFLLAIPLAFLGSMYFQLPIYYVVILGNAEEVIKLIVIVMRYKSFKWLKKSNLSTLNEESKTMKLV